MSRADSLSDKGQQFMDDLPPYYAEDDHALATQDSLAREYQRVEDQSNTLIMQGFPQNADDSLGILAVFEELVDLPIAPVGQSVASRRTRVLSRLRRRGAASGLAWEQAVTEQVGSLTWSYTENMPSSYSILVTLPYASTLPSPTGLVTGFTATGGTLAASTYYYVVTAINAYGETLKSAEASQVTTGSTGRVSLSWADVDGATGYRVYRSATSGAETLLGQTATASYNDTGSSTTSEVPPTLNSTGSPEASQIGDWLRKTTPAHLGLVVTSGAGFIVGRSRVGDETV